MRVLLQLGFAIECTSLEDYQFTEPIYTWSEWVYFTENIASSRVYNYMQFIIAQSTS